MPQRRFDFPPDFVWGSATAAYQVEGAAHADGRGDSVWDDFSRVRGNIADGSSGEEACRHYTLWREDLDLLKDLGQKAYRFSVAWPRIQPLGSGAFNARGFDFYGRLIDGLLERGIKPNCTLYHWDLPSPLERAGGWLNRDTALRYRDYAEAVAKRFGDRVEFWATFNEPSIFSLLGYRLGIHAPGRKESEQSFRQVIHHVLLAHGLGLQALRPNLRRPDAKAGIVLLAAAPWPMERRPGALAAAERCWQMGNDWWMLPMTQGRYPEGPWKRLGAAVPEVRAGDMDIIRKPLDYIGVNYYSPDRVLDDPQDPLGWKGVPAAPQAPRPDMPGWEIFAPGLRSVLLQFHRRYGLPIYITENGLGLKPEPLGPDGRVHDARRVDFLRRHLAEIRRAMDKGADVRGYFHWSLMDNFEWGFGYGLRFGLVHVDYQSYKRTPKDSALWYRDVIKNGGFEAEDEDQASPFDGA
ncbi:MAG TPA: GH1 family beta-glucosidase [bacterium]|nr:GH1 family beta-glucosidase [bacterium]